MLIRPSFLAPSRLGRFAGEALLACVASVSVWFRSKERPGNGILGFGRARNETRAKKVKEGGGGGEGRKETFLPDPLPAVLLAPFFARSLTLVPCSLLLNRTETLATQAETLLGVRRHGCIRRLSKFQQIKSVNLNPMKRLRLEF